MDESMKRPCALSPTLEVIILGLAVNLCLAGGRKHFLIAIYTEG